MARWTCPRCDREFGRARQSHTCVPGCTVEESFAGRPEGQREAYEAMLEHLATVGPVHVDAVSVGVFLKSDRTFAEIRPMARALSVQLVLHRGIDDPRVVRTLRLSGDRVLSVVRITGPSDVDDQLRSWLTEAYDGATD